MTATTREQFLAAAEHLFAEKGFYGASIATIARELGMTKQALLHHFGTKEKLYGEVLQAISERLAEDMGSIRERFSSPAEQLEEMLVHQFRGYLKDQDSARLIMRELLDNEQRADQAGNWYLTTYLDELVTMAMAVGTRKRSRAEALALVYQLLGAGSYFAVSQPTLGEMFGKPLLVKTRACYENELRRLIRAALQ